MHRFNVYLDKLKSSIVIGNPIAVQCKRKFKSLIYKSQYVKKISHMRVCYEGIDKFPVAG